MPSVLCQDCGTTFYVVESERWKRVCRFCYRKEMRATDQVAELLARVSALEARLAAAYARHARSEPTPLGAARLRQLLQLCHPDKHGGSPLAVEVTQWLLSQKKSAA